MLEFVLKLLRTGLAFKVRGGAFCGGCLFAINTNVSWWVLPALWLSRPSPVLRCCCGRRWSRVLRAHWCLTGKMLFMNSLLNKIITCGFGVLFIFAEHRLSADDSAGLIGGTATNANSPSVKAIAVLGCLIEPRTTTELSVSARGNLGEIMIKRGDIVGKGDALDRVVDSVRGTFRVILELANIDYSIPAGLNCQLFARYFSRLSIKTWARLDGTSDVLAQAIHHKFLYSGSN